MYSMKVVSTAKWGHSGETNIFEFPVTKRAFKHRYNKFSKIRISYFVLLSKTPLTVP